MKAIRCKSSSQVSSQVMIRLGLLIMYLVVTAAQQKKSDIVYQIFRGDIEKYELCIKLLRVCRNVWDIAPDYPDADEATPDVKQVNDEEKADYRKGNCVPTGLSGYGEKLFWEMAAKWQKYIDNRFLIQNLFMVIKTTENGRNTKVAFGKWQGWCNRTDISDETTEPSDEDGSNISGLNEREYSGKNCDEKSPFGAWVFSEINATLRLGQNMKRFSEVLAQLEKDARKKCCPYDSVRDRLEIINDGLDFLRELQGIEPSAKPEYTDISSDLSRLKNRFEHFNRVMYKRTGANYSTGKCCPNILNELNDVKNNFEGNIKDLDSQEPSFDYQPLLDTEKNLEEILLSQLKAIRQLESSIGNQNNKDTCCNDEKEQINNIETILRDLNLKNALEDLSKLLDPLKESLANTNKTLSATEKQLILKNENLQKLSSLYDRECLQKGTFIKNLHSKVDNLEYTINNMSSIKSVNWPELKKSVEAVNEMVQKNPSGITNITIVKTTIKETRFEGKADFVLEPKNSSSVRFCSNDSDKIKERLEKISKGKSDTIAYYEEQENMANKRFKEMLDQQKDLEPYHPKQNKGRSQPNALQLEINELERDIDNLTENGINKLDRQLQYTYLKFEIEKEQFDKKVEEQLKSINQFREEMKKEQDRIDGRLAELAAGIETPEEYDEKLSKLEASALEFPKQILSYEKELLDRIDAMEQQLKDLDNEMENTEHRADICDAECDFGALDSVDKLIGRVQTVRDKLSARSTYKRTPKGKVVYRPKTKKTG
ncbi:A-kinase anchor protein 9 [Drosophila subpulchrella]|uniref:A-kinase anchor protein 9 n=1 Tax=Drosophila subpulchrella TaxID=1486046 RepID=UPI0018A12E0B|nr:A-kinase anchor protein 9 [Drosophila subpulchrella]